MRCVICSLLKFVSDASGDHMVEVQEDTACTRLDCCRNCVYTIPAPRDGGPIPFFGQAGRRSLPPGWLCSSQKRGTSSQTLVQQHTNTLQSFGFVTSVINIKTNLNQMQPHTQHTVGSSEMHIYTTATIQT